MFLSDVFTTSFVNATGVPVELYQTDGSVGAALGAGVGAGFYQNESEAFAARKALTTIEPSQSNTYESFYQEWKGLLETQLQESALPSVIQNV
jgi:xylulokinase